MCKNEKQEVGNSQQNWFERGKRLAELHQVEYVQKDYSPRVFENGIVQTVYTTAVGENITLPLLDAARERLPVPRSVRLERYRQIVDSPVNIAFWDQTEDVAIDSS